jgi:CubicO group peptidase (beta-lactamase class C family)
MARYLMFLNDSGSEEARLRYPGILSRTSLEEMWSEVVPTPAEGEISGALGLTYFLLDFRGVRYVGHTGSQRAFFSFFYIDPEARTGALFALNTSGLDRPPRPDARGILNSVRDSLFREIFPLFQQNRFQEIP